MKTVAHNVSDCDAQLQFIEIIMLKIIHIGVEQWVYFSSLYINALLK